MWEVISFVRAENSQPLRESIYSSWEPFIICNDRHVTLWSTYNNFLYVFFQHCFIFKFRPSTHVRSQYFQYLCDFVFGSQTNYSLGLNSFTVAYMSHPQTRSHPGTRLDLIHNSTRCNSFDYISTTSNNWFLIGLNKNCWTKNKFKKVNRNWLSELQQLIFFTGGWHNTPG